MRYLIFLVITFTSCSHFSSSKSKVDRVPGRLCSIDQRFEGLQFVTVDAVDPPEFKEMVRVALLYWDYSANRRLLLYEPGLPSDVKRPAWIVVRIVSAGTTLSPNWGLHTAAHAKVFYSTVRYGSVSKSCITGAIVDVDPNVFYSLYQRDEAEKRLFRRIIHEIGHSIGIDHSWQEGTVMYHESGTGLRLGDDSREELLELYGTR